MVIQTQTFKDFFAYTKAIKPNNILSVYSYIKLSPGVLEKSNGSVYCKHTFECTETFEPLLLEEIEISTVVNNTSAQMIEIIVSDNITVKSGKITKSFASQPVNDFPTFPEGEGNATKVDARLLAIAAKYVDPKNIGWMQYPVMDKNGVLGTDGFKIFHHNTPMPSMVLSVECCQIISAMDDVYHYATDNTDFFYNEDVKYGFTKTSFNVPDFMFAVNKIQQGGIKVSKSDLLLFCDITTSDKAAIMKDGGEGKIILHLLDKDMAKSNEMVIDAEKDAPIDEFRFYPKYMSSLLRPLPYNVFNLHINNNLSFTTDEDSNYKGILSQLIVQ